MLNSTSKWLPSKTPLPACHGQRTPTNTTTTNQNQTGLQATTIPRTQTPTTTNQHQNQNPTLTKQFVQLRAANLPRRGRPILLRRQPNQPQKSQIQYQDQRPIFLKNYEILSQESYAQLLNQSQISNLNQVSTPSQILNPSSNSNPIQVSTPSQVLSYNQVQNPSQLLNQPTLLNQNQLSNQAYLLNSTPQIVDQSQLFYQKSLPNQTNSLNQLQLRPRKRLQVNPPTREIIIQQSAQEQNQETEITPVYQIISVPFLARSFLPTPSMKQRESKTNGLVKLKQIIVNANGKNDQKILVTQEQENILAHLNLSNQQQRPPSSNQVNITTERNLETTPINLNLTKTPTTTMSSYAMMGIQLPGDEFQDLNGALQIAAVEELMAPACLDDYFIETNNISDFDTTKGTYKLQELNEMTINQMNVNYAGQQLQLLPEDGQEQEQLLLKDIPGEEKFYNILRLPHSEELVTLTQPTIGHETSLESESLFTQYIDTSTNCLFSNCDDSSSSDNQSSSSYIDISPVSPLPTESDCIATSELHNHKYMDENCNSNKDEDILYSLELSPSPSIELAETQHNSPVCQSSADEEALDLEQILNQLEATSQQNNINLKRNSDHLVAPNTKTTKKPRMNLPIARLLTSAGCGDVLSTKVPDTPEVCEMVDEWLTEDIDTSIHSYSSSPSWSGTSFAPPDFVSETFTLIEPKYENPPSIASSYICEEPSYATPSPSNSSGGTFYSTNPNSPAPSNYDSVNGGTSRKRRGRPPKQHSDMPNPEVLRSLPENERKRIEDRCKNNEASRQSRQKNKEKQMVLLAEEECEQRRNEELKSRMRTLEKQHLKLKKVLYRKWGNNSSD